MAKKLTEDEIKWILSLDATQAQQSIHKLTKANKDLESSNKAIRAEMAKLTAQGKANSAEYENLNRQLKANSEAISKNKAQIREHEKTLGLENMTMKQLEKRYKELQSELKNTSKNLQPQQWNKLNKELRETSVAMGRVSNEAKKTSGIFGGLGKMKAAVLGGFMALGSYIGTQFFQALRNAFTTITEFEAANSKLAGILQKKKKEIKDLTNDALRLGKATKYTAGEVTGLQTELAKLGFNQTEILQATEHVLRFAEAVEAELPAAAKVAGAALRAFNLPATEMERVVSTLAVATTKSALDFVFLESSLSTIAPVARTFGFSIEETIALLGVLADSGFDASSAATATRNILLNLADGSGKLAVALGQPVKSLDDLTPALVKLRDSGVDLATTLELTDKRSVSAFNTFLQGAEKTTVLRDAITDAGGALKEMAEENLDNAAGSGKIMVSALEGLILKFYESRGIMKAVIDGITGIINALSWCIGKFTEYRAVLIPLTSAMVAYVAVLKTSVAWKKKNAIATGEQIAMSKTEALLAKLSTAAIAAKNTLLGVLTGKIKLATVAQKAWNIIMSLNPIGAIISLVAALVTALVMFASKSSAAAKAQKRLNEIQKEFTVNLAAERAEMDYLFKVAKNANAGTDARRTAIKLLNEKYGEYLPSLLTEKSTLEEIEKAQRFANDELVRSLSLKAKKQALEETTKAYMEDYEKMYNKFIKRISKGKSEEQKQVIQAQVNDIISWLKDNKIEYNVDTKVIKSSEKAYNEMAAKFLLFNKENSVSGTNTRSWMLELLGTTQKMNRELDQQSKYYDNIVNSITGTKKVSAKGNRNDVTPEKTVGETSLIEKLEKQKKKVQQEWKEDTEANIALKNKELEQIDKEIERLKNLGKVKAEDKTKNKEKKAEEQKKKTEEKEDKEAVTSLKKANTSALNGEEERYKKQKIELDNFLGSQKMSQEQHDMMMLTIDAVTAEKRLKIAQQYLKDAEALELHNGQKKKEIVEEANQKVLDAEAALAKARAKQTKVLENMFPEFKDKFNLANQEDELNLQLQALEASYQARLQMARENGKDTTSLTAAYEQAKTNILQKAEDDRRSVRSQYGLVTMKEQFRAELQILKANHRKGLLSEKEYQKARGKLAKEYYLGEVQRWTALAGGAIAALQDAEMARIDAKYDAEIQAAQGNTEEVERLENEKAQKKLDVEKKYADVQFAIKVSEIIANTGLSVMTAFAQLGPIGGAIAAGMLTATGAMQIAAANAERQKVKNMTLNGGGEGGGKTAERVVSGFAEGGYTGDGGRYDVAGHVHRGEYVVAVPEMRNPIVLNHVRAIEAFRRQRTSANPLPGQGYAEGGYVGSAGTQPKEDPERKIMLEVMAGLVKEVRAMKDKPIKAYTVYSDNQAANELMYKAEKEFTKGS